MAESYSVKATLSALDKGFTSTLKNAIGATDTLASKMKSGFSFGVFAGMGQQAFSAVSNGARELVGEINASSAAWKTFDGNMKILGKSEKEINSVKKAMQSYAEATIYSSSDMASTYAQLSAVGVKSADKLVTGFGGLAAAAENPTQAMKTLSQQATQMAGKPTVAWADFKLMMEQTPAGIAAVAKQMGMSTSDLVKKIQAGEVATSDFFAAVQEVGNSDGFTKLATEYKTVDQAMGGLKETLGNKLLPAFELVSAAGIKGISGIIDKVGQLDGEAIAGKVSAGLKAAQPYWVAFKDVVSDVWGVLKAFGAFLSEHSDTIAKYAPMILKLVLAYKAFKVVTSLVPGMSLFTKAIGSLAGKGLSGIAGKLFGVSNAQKEVGKSSGASAKKMLASAKAMLMTAAAVLLISVGFALLAQSAIALANSGGLAIGVMAGLVVGLVALGAGMMVVLKTLAPLGKKLVPVGTAMLAMGAAVLLVGAGFALMAQASIALASAGGAAIAVMVGMVAALALLAWGAATIAPALALASTGLIAFGAAILLVGAGALLAAVGITLIATSLPMLVAYGTMGATSLMTLGTSMFTFAAGAALAGAACIILGAGLLLIGAGVLLAGAGILLLGTGMLLLSTGAMIAATAVQMIATTLPILTAYGQQGAIAILMLSAGMTAFAVGAALAGAAALVLGAGLLVVGASLVVVGVGVAALAGGLVALAAGIVAIGLSIMVATGGLALLNLALPQTIQYGTAAAGAMVALGAGMLVLGAGALVAGAGCVVLGAGLIVAGAGLVVFGAGMVTGAAGTVAMAAALKAVSSQMKTISKNAKSAQKSLTSMRKSVKVVESGLDALGSKAKSAMSKLTNAFNDAAGKAQSAGQKVGTGFTTGMQAGLAPSPAVARQMVTAACAALSSGYSSAYSSGAYIGIGFANGMRSQLAYIRSAATQMAAAADAAVRAKARIASPSKESKKLGAFWGEGLAVGMLDMVREVWNAAQTLVDIPVVSTPNLALAYGGEMSSDYEYYRNERYTFDIPVTVDGREVARATATYTQDELDKRQTRENRKYGRV